MRTIAHILNPFKIEKGSNLYLAQQVTFRTLETAREFAKGQVDVTIYTAQFPQDRPIIPDSFHFTTDLDRTILNIKSFKVPRPLPLIKDILDRIYSATGAEYLIYTNADIALMPFFYSTVDAIIEAGFDGFVINRRTLSESYTSLNDLPKMYSDLGESHRGYDCFVFRREVYPKYLLGDICVGMAWVGRALLANVLAHSHRFVEIRDKHFTFHLGDDQLWRNPSYNDYMNHNRNEYLRVYESLEAEVGGFDSNTRSFLLDTGTRRQPLQPALDKHH